MYRSTCFLRIGAGRVDGSWQSPRWAGARRVEAAAAFGADEPNGDAPLLSDAVAAVLDAILPPRRLMSPFVRVSLGPSHVMAAILPFTALPKSAADRALVISQRFCREHRLEPASVAVIASPQANSKTGAGKVLCFAVEQGTLAEIKRALTEKGLHPDVISPDYLLSFASVNSPDIETPGIAVMQQSGGGSIPVWDEQGTIVHIAAFAHPLEEDMEAGRRLTARIRRYAQAVASQDGPVAVYIEDTRAGGIAADLAHPAYGLKHLPWPSAIRVTHRMSQAAEP